MSMRNNFDTRAALERCLRYRRRILDISQQVSALHIGSAYSCTEIVDAIYHGLMDRRRDTFLMSKGHGCMIQYAILEELGVLSRADLDAYCTPEGRLGVHPDYGNPGIEGSTGSLGHGLSMVVGMALAERARNTRGTIYTVLSDGELQEGSIWEATMMASSLNLSNIVAFVDNNDFQSLGRTSETHPNFYPVVDKYRAFGWECVEVPRPRSGGDLRCGGEPRRHQAVHGRGQDHQGERRQLHGERADLALPLAEPAEYEQAVKELEAAP